MDANAEGVGANVLVDAQALDEVDYLITSKSCVAISLFATRREDASVWKMEEGCGSAAKVGDPLGEGKK